MKTRVIPTKTHGIIDYVTAPALTAAPDLLRLDGGRPSSLTPRVLGTGAAVYSALTDYELGVRRVIPMRIHLLLDAVSGAALATAPWLFGSARRGPRHWLPHAVIGTGEVAVALVTKTEPPRTTGLRRVWAAIQAAPGKRALAVTLGAGMLAAVAYAGRRHALQGVALAADVVEDAADAVEDAAEDVAGAARRAAEQGSEPSE
jgi:hypothetical protein